MKKVESWVSPSAAITKAEAQTTKAFKNKHCNSRQGAGEAISRSGETWRSTGSHQTSFHKAAGNCHSKRCLTDSAGASFPKEDSVTVLFRKALLLRLLHKLTPFHLPMNASFLEAPGHLQASGVVCNTLPQNALTQSQWMIPNINQLQNFDGKKWSKIYSKFYTNYGPKLPMILKRKGTCQPVTMALKGALSSLRTPWKSLQKWVHDLRSEVTCVPFALEMLC